MKSVNSKVLSITAALAIAVTSASAQTATATEGQDPFTHVARIPAGSNLSSIKFQGVKVVMVPTKSSFTTDARYCEQAARRDPGGSMFCPAAQPQAWTRAYQVTYSFEGPPLASDEFGNTHYTFSVYFRPEELNAKEREALSQHRVNRTTLAEYFQVTNWRGTEERQVVDHARSRECAGSYVDGLWTQTDPACHNDINFQTLSVASDYIAVKVGPASSRGVALAASAQ
jgi:hypothetical protein